MNREIFRGKSVNNGKWVEGDGIHYPKSINYKGTCWIDGMHERANDWVQVIPSTVGRYTGLDDSTKWTDLFDDKYEGRPIFEHDICKDSQGTLFVVEWDKRNARFIGRTVERDSRIVYIGKEPKVKVIGNIYDNPEMLEVEK